MTDESPLSELLPATEQMLSRLTPCSEDAVRAYHEKHTIFPTIERWGFDDRFHRHVEMHPRQQRAFELTLERLKLNGSIVALVGERGLGKTTIAAQLAIRQAWKNHESIMRGDKFVESRHFIYRKCSSVVSKYKALYADYGHPEIESLRDSLNYLCRNQEFLVIDELHDCDDQKMKTRVLTDLIDRRYSALRDTILISNQSPAEFVSTTSDSILSRLNEHGCILECKWPSYRKQ